MVQGLPVFALRQIVCKKSLQVGRKRPPHKFSRILKGIGLSAFIDARTAPSGRVVHTDLAIIGGGPAGISLALSLANTPIKMVMLESGAMEYEEKVQNLYKGEIVGDAYLPLDAVRLRYLGGSSNHWGGWCRPLDEADFLKREWMPYSGWPFERKEMAKYYPQAQTLCEAGPQTYDRLSDMSLPAPEVKLGEGAQKTRWFQFSKMKDDVLPTHFGERYAAALKKQANLQVYIHANATNLQLNTSGKKVEQVDVASLSGHKFTVKAKIVVVALGGIETPRLLLASNTVRKAGVGNENDLVGRFFADHPVPREVGTLVMFNGPIPGYYLATKHLHDMTVRASFAPREDYRLKMPIMGSQTTVEYKDTLDEVGKAAVAATASALGVDAKHAVAYSLGCGLEPAPDPDRRFTLDGAKKDALGMPRLKLHMKINQEDFDHYREMLSELGRQLLVSRTGMIRLNLKERSQWLDGLSWGNHHMGTTRMHEDPKLGVVDADMKVHGNDNLYIAGSSVFPTYGASNPTMNLIALTVRLADHIKGKLV